MIHFGLMLNQTLKNKSFMFFSKGKNVTENAQHVILVPLQELLQDDIKIEVTQSINQRISRDLTALPNDSILKCSKPHCGLYVQVSTKKLPD